MPKIWENEKKKFFFYDPVHACPTSKFTSPFLVINHLDSNAHDWLFVSLFNYGGVLTLTLLLLIYMFVFGVI